MLSAAVLSRGWLAALSLLGAVLRSAQLPTSGPVDSLFRFLLGLVANLSAALFVYEVVRNRRRAQEQMEELERQRRLREEAEEQMRMLAESSPAAILTLDHSGAVLNSNRAAAEMFGYEDTSALLGERITNLLPILSEALRVEPKEGGFRAAVQAEGRRRDGDLFLAQIWFSTYYASGHRRLAAIAVDQSEEMREREEQNLRHLQDSNRIVAGAVSHEIRNICSAASVVFSNLRRRAPIPAGEDFEALGNLVGALERIAETGLQISQGRSPGLVDLGEALKHLRIVISPAWLEAGGRVVWRLAENLPLVTGESYGLMQAFLNLSQNSLRAVQSSSVKELVIEAKAEQGKATVSFLDSGPGVAEPASLFAPFQSKAESTGLGLYVARSILRSYGGDLRHDPGESGCRFVIELQARHETNPAFSR